MCSTKIASLTQNDEVADDEADGGATEAEDWGGGIGGGTIEEEGWGGTGVGRAVGGLAFTTLIATALGSLVMPAVFTALTITVCAPRVEGIQCRTAENELDAVDGCAVLTSMPLIHSSIRATPFGSAAMAWTKIS